MIVFVECVFWYFRFQGKLRVGTRIFKDCAPNQQRISLSQIPNYNEETFGYVSNSLSCPSQSQDDEENDPVTTTRTTTKKKNYQYQGNFGFNITKFAGGDEQCQRTSKKDNSGTKSRSTSRKYAKKSNFNRKENRFNGDG